MVRIFFYLLICFSFFYYSANGAVGCASVGSTFVYINQLSTAGGPGGIPEYSHVSEASRRDRSVLFCVSNTTSPAASCWINSTRSGFFSQYGVIVNYQTTARACPIDDYILFLILPIGIFGFYYLRKRSLLIA